VATARARARRVERDKATSTIECIDRAERHA
jgi:hypothetical protein